MNADAADGRTPDGLDHALREVFGPGSGASVLGRLDPEGKIVSRILLREEDSEPGQVVTPKPPDAPGGAIDRYQVVGEIARGGVGVVLKGRDVDLGRDVALKMLREEHAENPEVLQRFVEEAQIGGQLQHPGIVPVYDLGMNRDRRPYFTMKLVKGRTLAALLAERKDPGEDRRRFLQIFEATCQTVAYAHARGVIHRDLKPANVMVGAFGEVLVVDWGMGKVLTRGGVADERKSRISQAPEQTVIETVRSDGTGSNSVVGSVMGTLRYMPPEQATGDVERMDERSDVFSLGAILCEILTGQPPYVGEGKDVFEMAARGRLEGAHERLDVCGADGDLVELAKVCLAPAPAARPKDAGAVASEIAAHLASLDEKARQAQLDAEAARVKALEERRRRRLSVLLAASVVLLVLLGAGGWTWRQAELRQRSDEIARRVDTAIGEVTRLRGRAAAAAPEEAVALWGEALGAARQALAVAEAPDGETGPRERAQALVEDLEAEQARAQERAAAAERDEAMVRRLEEIHGEFADSWDKPATGRAYAAAFREHLGVDLVSAPVEAAADLLARSAIREELALALEEWMSYRGAEAPRLASVLERADPDPWRARLRRAAGDREALARLMDAADLETLPVESLLRLALGFHGVRDAVRMRQVALAAWRRAPGDFWACLHCGMACDRQVPSDVDGAIRFYTAAVAARPGSFVAYINLGAVLSDCGRLEEAEAAQHEAIRIRPENPWAHANLASVLGVLGRREEALAEAREAVRLAPAWVEAHCFLSEALLKNGFLDEAVAEAREAVRLNPASAWGHAYLGLALREKGLAEEAEAEGREAVRLDPGYTLAHVNLAGTLFWLGRVEEAIDVCREAIRLTPWSAGAHSILGCALVRAGRVEEALAALREAVRLSPSDAAIRANLGTALQAVGRLDDAVAAFRRAIELDPANVQARSGLGTVLSLQGRHDEALGILLDTVRRYPYHAEVHCALSMALWGKGRFDEAVDEALEAIRLKPDLAEAHSNLGLALYEKGRLEESIAASREAIRLKPESPAAHLTLANALFYRRQHEEALAACREAIRLRPGDPLALNALGNILRRLRRVDEAEAAYREAIRLDPGYTEARNGLGVLLLVDRGLADESIAVLREAIRLKPEYANAHANLGNALREKGLLDEAEEACREALRLEPENASAHMILGGVLFAKRRPEEAIAELRRAIRLDPDSAGAHATLGFLLCSVGRPEEAIAACREAIRLEPDLSRAHAALGLALRKSLPARLDEAVERFREAIRLDPRNAVAHGWLGNVLLEQGRLDEAIAACGEAIRLEPRLTEAYRSLGLALSARNLHDEAIEALRESVRQSPGFAPYRLSLAMELARVGRLGEAEAAFRETIRLDPEHAEAHCNFASCLARQGRFEEALALHRRGHELGSRRPDWRYPSALWVQQAERAVALERRLPAVLDGREEPGSPADALALGEVAHVKRLYAASAGLRAEGLVGLPAVAGDLRSLQRYNAACAAALAGAGKGEDAGTLDEAGRARWRAQAVAWLRADLALWAERVSSEPARVRGTVGLWPQDSDLAGIRDEAEIAKLPPEEREACRALWRDVAALLGTVGEER